jgi:hypothetical protein
LRHAILVLVSSIKIIVEKHDDGFVAYPIGIRGIVVGEGEGDSYPEALADVCSAIHFHIEMFGDDVCMDAPLRNETYNRGR